jgi:hypothetical protein
MGERLPTRISNFSNPIRSTHVTGGNSMFNQLLPERIDNTYHGYKLALWLFGLVLLMKVGISVATIFNGYVVASSADGIPLNTFTPAGARTVVSLFALWGLSHLMICLLCILVLLRYRSMIPFMFGLLLVEQLSRKAILQIMPIVTTGTSSGSAINLALLTMMVIGLVLSLWTRAET